MKYTLALLATLVAIAIAAPGFAQGVQTGTIRGTVKDQQGLAVPGVTVTATSPALQGSRSTVTDADGLYTHPRPAARRLHHEVHAEWIRRRDADGERFHWASRSSRTRRSRPPASPRRCRSSRRCRRRSRRRSSAPTCKHEEIEALATPRTLEGIATLSPGVTENSPNSGQMVVNGALAFDNIFMINGVDVNDNLFATPQNLFIEDAIEETQVLTAGISAEYGRFTGGVVNAVTKSGGNMFTGSGRVNFLNPDWTTATPFEVTKGTATTAHPDTLQERYEGTFGGPIVKDRLWFFGSGRYQNVSTPQTLPQTGISVPGTNQNKRFELKLTGTVANGHTIQGGYLTDNTYADQQLGAPVVRHRPAQRGELHRAEQLLLHELQGRARQQPPGRGAVLAAPLRVQRRRRLEHRHQRLRRSSR